MRIIILGAGQVGKTVAAALSHEQNDITVIDQNNQLLKSLEKRLDIRTVHGHASHPDDLSRASAEDADMLLAVTDSDETNMIACQIAYTLFQIPTRLARIRAPSYQSRPELFSTAGIPVNHIISPELLLVRSIEHLIEHPEALQILDFADGRVRLTAVKAHSDGPMVGHELRHLSKQVPDVSSRIVAVYRQDQPIIANGRTVIEKDDEVFFLTESENMPAVLSVFGQSARPSRRIIVGGGGKVGQRLAERIESRYFVKLIEVDNLRCRNLAKSLFRSIILNGDVTDASLLKEESIGDTDIYCAVTNDDETNILSAMLAKRNGVRKTLSIINHPDYLDLTQGDAVDVALSPTMSTIGEILTHIRRGDIAVVHSLRRGVAEAIEIIIHGDWGTSRVVDRKVKQLPLPEGTTIGGIYRNGKLIFVNSDTSIKSEDHVILFLADKRRIPEIESLFQVKYSFL